MENGEEFSQSSFFRENVARETVEDGEDSFSLREARSKEYPDPAKFQNPSSKFQVPRRELRTPRYRSKPKPEWNFPSPEFQKNAVSQEALADRIRQLPFLFGARRLAPFAAMALFTFGMVSMGTFSLGAFGLEARVLGESTEELDTVRAAVEDMRAMDFESSARKFSLSSEKFRELSDEFGAWAGLLENVHASTPILSKIASGANMLEAARALSEAGEEASRAAKVLVETKESARFDSGETALLGALRVFSKHIEASGTHLEDARKRLDRVRIDHLPEDKRDAFLALRSALPAAAASAELWGENAEVFEDLLGVNGPRKYLFLFQNTHEARATGGFIGSYGRLDMHHGEIEEFFVDNVFNPGGQLREDIVPPEPIRKVSAGWSLHDSNWFLDFPTSAEKAMSFYEKSGGPTTDGVIAITPEVLRRMLAITGPVAMPEYGTEIDAENFMEAIQYEVEEDFDEEENRPKKILSDLAPEIVDRFLANARGENIPRVLEIFSDLLAEKHILAFSRNESFQSLIEEMGFSGSVADAPHNFFSLVHSNINGFKTDAVIDETIDHTTDIRPDGSVVETVVVRREHTGGDTPYEWYNGVNADYMRLYVPLGSKPLSVSGHTRETVRNPLDYEALEFSVDEDVAAIEESMMRDEATGTQIFEESGKTVFGNWVYVSPKENVTVTYRYELPFRLDMKGEEAVSFSTLAQKQPGSSKESYRYTLRYPASWHLLWAGDSWEDRSDGSMLSESRWERDEFHAAVFGKDGEM